MNYTPTHQRTSGRWYSTPTGTVNASWGILLEKVREHLAQGTLHPMLDEQLRRPDADVALAWGMCFAALGGFSAEQAFVDYRAAHNPPLA